MVEKNEEPIRHVPVHELFNPLTYDASEILTFKMPAITSK